MFKWLNIRKVNLSVQHWLEAEATLLGNIIEEMGTHASSRRTTLNWKVVSERLYKANPLEGKIFRSAKQCREHWNCYLNPKLKKGPWNIGEDI